jgi:CheY-like chemotaxis protein
LKEQLTPTNAKYDRNSFSNAIFPSRFERPINMDLAFPFRFPIAILLVDDDKDVIDNAAQTFFYRLPGHIVYKMHSAKAAIKLARAQPLQFQPLPSEIDFNSFAPRGEVVFNTDSLSNLDILAEHAKQIGIVVVDYDMPEMSGVEFAKEIEELSLPKILLTGKATHDDAIEAFNARQIDRYVSKDESKSLEKLISFVLELQREQFSKFNMQFISLLGDGHFSYLKKPDIQCALNELCEKLGAERTAPHFDPPGLLVASRNGATSLIIVVDANAVESRIEIAQSDGVSNEVIDAMRTRTGLYIPDLGYTCIEQLVDRESHPHLYKISPLTKDAHFFVSRISSQ